METWVWLIAYVVTFGLVQLLLYRYFQRDDPTPEATPRGGDQSASRSLDGATANGEASGLHCRHCGTFNENVATMAFCRECVEPLR